VSGAIPVIDIAPFLDGGAREELIVAIIRGDMDVNETKLANAVGASWLRPAEDEAIRSAGATPGYASPMGLTSGTVVVDDSVPASPNLVAGANEQDVHLRNVNAGRDYEPGLVADIAAAEDGHACVECGQRLRTSRGVEVGNIFQLGTRYGDAAGARFLDDSGAERPIWMGSYGIGSGRLLACVAEEHHDEGGLCWPMSVSPYDVHLIPLSGRSANDEAGATAERLHDELQEAGLEVLLDDRDERAGVKFADADLIGIPLRVVVSGRSLGRGGAEVRVRGAEASEIVPLDGLAAALKAHRTELLNRIESAVRVPEFG
jgi:prolyl-tRNA synthetase